MVFAGPVTYYAKQKHSLGLFKRMWQSKVVSRVAIVWHLRWLVRTKADISLRPSGLVRPKELISSCSQAYW